jgi:hypothetical protein
MSKVSYLTRKMSDKDFYLSQASRPRPGNAFSQYRGVSKGNKGMYRAVLTFKGKRYYLGTYEHEIDAAHAYNKAALAIIGDYALINELPEEEVKAQ